MGHDAHGHSHTAEVRELPDLLMRVRQQEDRADILDALHRFAVGQDLKDWELFASAFTHDAQLDFTQPAQLLGHTIDVFRGRETILNTVSSTLSALQTTHTISNERIELTGDTASMFALVEAQHLRANDHSRYLLLKNFYWVELRRSTNNWRIASIRIKNAWLTGEPSLLFGP